MRGVVRTALDLQRFCAMVEAKLDGKPYTITVKRFHRPRTTDQNAKFHAMVRDLADHIGYSVAELKEIIKVEFLPTVTGQIGELAYTRPMSTSDLTVQAMSELIEHVYELGAQVDCVFQDDET